MPEQLEVGEILDGKYRVEGLIGSGGMGAVYRARHIELDSSRAIKLMRPELAKDDSFVQRFENEAHLAEGVRHPNVVALYDFAALPDGTKYIVWELVEGETLRDCLERGVVFSASDVVRLVTQIGGGLAAAHKQGIYHRDVSPDNIMICADSGAEPTMKLLDFGVAKAAGTPQSVATTMGMVFGKIGFASPEQMGLLKGEKSLDARADIFSLAAVAYAMLIGEPPFVTTSMRDFLHDLMIAPESDVRERFAKALYGPWRASLTRALARDRNERPATMEAFVDEIREIARAPRPSAEASRAGRAYLALGAAAVIVLVSVAAFRLRVDISSVPSPPLVELGPRSVDFSFDDVDPWVVPDEGVPDTEPVPVDARAVERSEPIREELGGRTESEVDEQITFVPEVAAPSGQGTTDVPSREPPPLPTEEVPESAPQGEIIEIEEPPAAEPRIRAEVEAETTAPTEAAWVEPQLVETVEPVYPERAKRLFVEGTVVLEIVIAPSGDVTDVKIVEGVHRDLDRAAVEAVRQWRYEPRDDPLQIQVRIGFSLTS